MKKPESPSVKKATGEVCFNKHLRKPGKKAAAKAGRRQIRREIGKEQKR